MPIMTYCLFCQSGQENRVISHLQKRGFSTLAPTMQNWISKNGQQIKTIRRFLPGYIFFESEIEPDWYDVNHIPCVYHILKYADGNYALHGTDLDFVSWLKKFNGKIDVSFVIQEGSKIHFVSGPMMELHGKIVKVNKKRKKVLIQFGQENGLFQSIWCSIDYVKNNIDTDTLDYTLTSSE